MKLRTSLECCSKVLELDLVSNRARLCCDHGFKLAFSFGASPIGISPDLLNE